jgi:hypothetical protein
VDDTGGQSSAGVGSPVDWPFNRARPISAQAMTWRTISQMLCAPAIGRAAAPSAGDAV